MTQSLQLKIRGLHTFPNDFSEVPEGALSLADNIIIDRESIAEPRRGFTYLAKEDGSRADFSTDDLLEKVYFYKDGILILVYNNGKRYLNYYDPDTGWKPCVGSGATEFEIQGWSNDTPTIRPTLDRGNIYLPTSGGLLKMDSLSSFPKYAGTPEAVGITESSLSNVAGYNWLDGGESVTYRSTWTRVDSNNLIVEGAPSPFYVFTNTLGAGNLRVPTLTICLNGNNVVGDILKLYRSAVFTTGSNDELQQVYEYTLIAGDVTAGYVSVSDYSGLGALGGNYLYTNSNQQGIELANMMPPLCKDSAVYRDCMFLFNIQDQSTYSLQIRGTNTIADLYALVAGDTITIGNGFETAQVYTGIVPGAPGSKQFQVFTAGTPYEDSRNTAISLVSAINIWNSNIGTGFYAQYIESGETEILGTIVIKRNGFSVSSPDYFYVNSSKQYGWLPPLLPVGSVDSNSRSSFDVFANGVACSKPNQSESFASLYRFYPGSQDSEVIRGLSLRDSLFMLKEDGTYRLFGTDPSNFQVQLMDATATIIAPDTAVVLNNQILCLTTQGVVAITENGVSIISRAIESDILGLIQTNLATIKKRAFAVASESQRAYYLWLPTTSTDTECTQYYRYNILTNNWTHGTLTRRCGGVNPADDLMYVGEYSYTRKWLEVEKKTNSSFDYADYVTTETISNISSKTVTISNASTLVAGYSIYQYSYIIVLEGTGGGFDHTTETITYTNHGFITGDIVRASATVAIPTGINILTDYYVIKVTDDSFRLATSLAYANAGTNISFANNGVDGEYTKFSLQTSDLWANIVSVGATEVVIDYPIPFRKAAVIVYKPIDCAMKWVPNAFQNPGINKQVREASLLFLSDFYGTGRVSFKSDLSQSILYETVRGCVAAPWGMFPWGLGLWGEVIRRRPLRVGVPRVHMRNSWLQVGWHHAVCFSPWKIQGISLIGNNISEKVWHEGSTV